MRQSQTSLKQKQGFSLVELLVVMAIIAILMGIVLGVSGVVQRKAADVRGRAKIADLMTQIEFYKNDEGQYPPSTDAIGFNSSENQDKRKVMVLYRTTATDPKGFMDWYEEKYPDTRFDLFDLGTKTVDGVDIEYFKDVWGKPIIYEYDPDESPFVYLIGSTGPDGGYGKGYKTKRTVFGEVDDLTNRNGAL
ncbi:prepilin-type N-terminal cleavage/methylation domain-containing protein [Kiritimatiellota bacterium B12222]|nr:prepilin-type N-terminal cleavage/methylation domain-containing protein [Kiritimatiellota bacterium B12222]